MYRILDRICSAITRGSWQNHRQVLINAVTGEVKLAPIPLSGKRLTGT